MWFRRYSHKQKDTQTYTHTYVSQYFCNPYVRGASNDKMYVYDLQTVYSRKQVVQLSLTNSRDALHHCKRQNFKQSRDHNHTHLGGDMSSFLVTLDINYMCKRFDKSSFSYFWGMFRALKFKVDYVTWPRPFQEPFVARRQ